MYEKWLHIPHTKYQTNNHYIEDEKSMKFQGRKKKCTYIGKTIQWK